MRNEFVTAMMALAERDPRLVFLTGDLGYKALEPLRNFLKDRFINAGVAEQNMVSVAAGLAAQGLHPWVYSIAPFATLRPYEQIRNDICFHKAKVKIVGNGGGYGYGIMGATHHTLEDIACMRVLPGMGVYVPAYATDVEQAVNLMASTSGPGYLRLGMAVKSETPAPFSTWRRVAKGTKGVIVTLGPVLQGLQESLQAFPEGTFEVWLAGQFPWFPLPSGLIEKIGDSRKLISLEEHQSAGGLGESLAAKLLATLNHPIQYVPLTAHGYPSGKYGSQRWHLEENGLAGKGLTDNLNSVLNG